jgi:hypothetical protein
MNVCCIFVPLHNLSFVLLSVYIFIMLVEVIEIQI